MAPAQLNLYKEYLLSKECHRILTNKLNAFLGLITLRKLCNHPDLVNGGPTLSDNDAFNGNLDDDAASIFGAACRSGKMLVLKALLKLWANQKQRVLLFSQSRQMLAILERFVILEKYTYFRMDGTTPIGQRPSLVQRFNEVRACRIHFSTRAMSSI